ncbi:MAG: zinc-finger domain-containing protein [Alphaproteobacteria bacterium]|nr:zinc-finger domain-containing protein [Alphaproteobacteria bacterium]
MKPDHKDIVTVETAVVGCDGGEGALGHPLVFLKMDDSRQVECPYCGRLFQLKDGLALDGGH